MKGVILDTASLGQDIDLSPLTDVINDWQMYTSTNVSQVAERIKGADVVLSNKVTLSATDIQQTTTLKLICVMATGTNNIDLVAAQKQQVLVCNATGYATASVVQHTIALMLALTTRLIHYVDDVKEGQWQNSPVFCLLDHPILELSGKTLGIVGYGELGRHVAPVARSLGMEIITARRPGVAPTQARRVDPDEPPSLPLEDLLPRVDVLTLHCPLTAQTHHLINQSRLAMMKPSALIVNTARGGLIDSKALVQALQQGIIAGAAVDVLATEPPDQHDPLLNAKLHNLIITPHVAWAARESRQRLVVQLQENIKAFLNHQPIRQVSPD
jgi:glycerate dehydrogenase